MYISTSAFSLPRRKASETFCPCCGKKRRCDYSDVHSICSPLPELPEHYGEKLFLCETTATIKCSHCEAVFPGELTRSGLMPLAEGLNEEHFLFRVNEKSYQVKATTRLTFPVKSVKPYILS